MFYIVGIGNPGDQYTNNRHNVGYRVVDDLANRLSLEWTEDKYLNALVAKSDELMVLKPLTFVNESGTTIVELSSREDLDATKLCVVHDDTEIDFGEVRVKFAGTSGGHNGIKSIDAGFNPNYWRVRVGVGRPENKNIDLADYVLANFTAEQEHKIGFIIDQTVEYLVKSIEDKVLITTTFNAQKD